MSNIIDATDLFAKVRRLDSHRSKPLSNTFGSSDPSLAARIDRIKTSIVRINELMRELRELPKPPKSDDHDFD